MNKPVTTAALSEKKEELYPLFERIAGLYTMGDTTSLPVETVRELLKSLRFVLSTGASAGGDHTLEELYDMGGKELWRLAGAARELLELAKKTDPGYGSLALRDTLGAIGGFFGRYDLRFFAHDIPCMIDYPLCLPVSEELLGVSFIGEYLRRLIIENRFCASFDRGAAQKALSRFMPDYKELVVNLFEPVFRCALGLALLGKDPASLTLDRGDCGRLYLLFHPFDREAAAGLLGCALQRINSGREGEAEYLKPAAENILPFLRVASPGGYLNLFCAAG
ncbi:MAG: DUF6179 domain-containing protein [Oscillospiraceae bacterium]|nr:DUF6179 domain-containing protein [Oscillospiraceae bacterium]